VNFLSNHILQFPHLPDEKDGFKEKLKIHMCKNEEKNVYALVINGYCDKTMIYLASKYDFPRGCVVVWRSAEFITVNGFYSKFQNYQENPKFDKEWEKMTEVRLVTFFVIASDFVVLS